MNTAKGLQMATLGEARVDRGGHRSGNRPGAIRHGFRSPALLVVLAMMAVLAANLPAVAWASNSSDNVTGQVLALSGSGFTGTFQVSAYDQSTNNFIIASNVPTPGDGSYSLQLPQGNYQLVAMPLQSNPGNLAPGTTTIAVPTGGGAVSANITLQSPNLSGLITDPGGNPVANAFVDAATSSGTASNADSATTDSTGHYYLALTAGSYQLSITPPPGTETKWAGVTTAVTVPVSGSTTADASLQTVNVTAKVTAPDGTAVPNSQIDGLQGSATQWTSGIGLSDTNGNVYLHLAPGNWQLRAQPTTATEPTDATSAAVSATVPASGSAPALALALQSSDLVGTVYNSDGTTPAAGVSVSITDANQNQLDFMTSDSSGRFGFHLATGAYSIVADPFSGVGATSRVDNVSVSVMTVTTQDLTLSTPNVTGLVQTPDATPQPVSGAQITVNDGNGNQVATTQSASDGSYALHLPAGSYTVVADPPSNNPTWLGSSTTSITVPASGAVSQNITLRAPTIFGRVFSPDGLIPQPGSQITVYDVTARQVPNYGGYIQSDGNGNYGLTLPLNHTYRITAVPAYNAPASYRAATITVDVAAQPVTGASIAMTPASALPWQLQRVALDAAGQPVAANSDVPAVSGDGAHVVFTSNGSGLTSDAASSSGSHRDVYERDLSKGTTTLVSQSIAGTRADNDSTDPVVSSDGSSVAFSSAADDLVASDTNYSSDVYLSNGSGLVDLSIDPSTGKQFIGDSVSPTISGDGQIIALVGQRDVNDPASGNIYLVNLASLSVLTAVTTLSNSSQDTVDRPVLSNDGSTLAYYRYDSTAQDWLLEIYDVATGQTTAGPTVVHGANLFRAPPAPSLSSDGSTLVYSELDVNGIGTLEKYSVTSNTFSALPTFGWGDLPTTNQGCNGATAPQISADASTLSFLSCSPANPDGIPQLWTLNLTESGAEPTLVSANLQGISSYASPVNGGLSTDGTTVAFDSNSTDLFANQSSSYDTAIIARSHTDSTPPTWPSGAALTTSDVGRQNLTLHWPAATDASGIAKYLVYQGGTQIASAPVGATPSYVVTGLTADTQYTFTVQAVDRFDNVTADGPTVTARTASGTPPAGSAFLQATMGTPSTVHLTWESAPTASFTAYRIYRSIGSGTPVKVTDVATTVTSYSDKGVVAATKYTYRVVVVDASGNESPWTQDASVTTPSLSPLTVKTIVPLLHLGLATLGKTIPIVASGDPGRTVTATVDVLSWFDSSGNKLTAPAARTLTVPLTESSSAPGTYQGTVPIAEGTSQISGITATMTDGAGHSVFAHATSLPVAVSGAITTTITSPGEPFPGGRLLIDDAATWGGADQQIAPATSTDPIVNTLPLAAATTPLGYSAELYTTINTVQRQVASADNVVVQAGLTTPISLIATYPATLTVTYTGDVANLDYVDPVINDANGNYVGSAQMDPLTHQVVIGDLTSNTDVSLSTELPPRAPLTLPASQSVHLGPGDNQVSVNLQALATSDVTGRVLAPDGSPASGATVTLSESADARSWSFDATTGTDGTYDITAFVGSGATLSAGFRDQTMTQAIGDLTANGVQVPDFQMSDPQPYLVGVDLEVQVLGSSSYSTLSVDWRTALHYSLNASTPSSDKDAWSFGLDGGSDVNVLGRPGDTVQICGNGHDAEGVIPYDEFVCGSATLGDPATPPTVQLKFAADGALHGALATPNGSPFTGNWSASVSQTSGGSAGTTTLDGTGSQFQFPVAQDGTYDVTVASAADPNVVVRASGTVTASSNTDLGTLLLTGGKFFGAASTLKAAHADVAPGGSDDVRVTLINGSSDVTSASLQIPVPASASIPSSGITVGGQPATGVTTGSGVTTVPLGDIGAGQSVDVHYTIDAGTAAPGSSLLAEAAVHFSAAGSDHSEWLTPQPVLVDGVTLSAPGSVASPAITTSGRAPAGDSVTVYDGGTQIGSTVAGPGGYWSLPVTLNDHGAPSTHFLHATAAQGDTTLTSAPVSVSYDTNQPVLTKVSVYQIDKGRPDGRKFSYDPRAGEAHFSFVFVPGQPLVVEATFTHADRVSNVVAHVNGMSGNATDEGNGVFTTQFDAPTGVGSISFDYDVSPTPMDLTQSVPQDELQASMPSGAAGFTVVQAPSAVNGGPSVDGGGETMTLSLPGLGKNASGVPHSLQTTITRSTIQYTPTAADILNQTQTGVPIWGISAGENADGTFSASLVIPQSASTPSVASRARLRTMSLRGDRMAVPHSEVGIAVKATEFAWKLALDSKKVWGSSTELTWEQAFNRVTTAYSADQATVGNNTPDINGLWADLSKAEAHSCLTQSDTKLLTNEINGLYKLNMYFDGLGVVNDGIGLVLAPETFGLGTLALGALSMGLSQATNNFVGNAVAQVSRDIANFAADENCADKEFLMKWGPGAHSTGATGDSNDLVDPSGYAYSGVTSNRISGVQATALRADASSGPWSVWSAADFGQVSPQYTNDQGQYGWYVPTGYYKVAFSAPGYLPAQSSVVQVLPPHFDVNVDMTPATLPTLRSATATNGSELDFAFDQYMDPATLTSSTVSVLDSAGRSIIGTLAPVGAQKAPDGTTLARSFSFTPNTALAAGSSVTLTIDSSVRNFAGSPLAASISQTLQIPVPTSGGGGGGGGGGSATEPTNAPPPSSSATDGSVSYGTPVSQSVLSGTATTISQTSNGATDTVTVPLGALPGGTTVSVYPVTDTAAINAQVPAGQSYVVSFAVTWETPSGTSPPATTPITMTITDPSIKAGDTIYMLTSTGPVAVGTATVNGTVTITFSSDPTFLVSHKVALVVQAALTLTSLSGTVGTALTFTSSGGSGSGALTYALTSTGTAGCWITGSTLKATSAGTCTVTVTKAADSTYLVASSVATTVTFTAAVVPVKFTATRVIGFVRVGRTVLVSIIGTGFYNKPTIKSNEARTSAVVIHDHGNQLVVRVKLLRGSAPGWHVFTIILSNGHSCKVRYLAK